MKRSNNNPTILIVEDDRDQMNLLVNFALIEIKTLIDDENTNDEERQKLKNIQIARISNISSLKKAVSICKNVLLAVLDCNIPDTKDGISHDQLVKTNYRITGQHQSVDIVTEHLPETPITIISSLDRFQKIVTQYYETKYSLSINFIRKNDPLMIGQNITHHLRQYLAAAQGSSYNEIKA